MRVLVFISILILVVLFLPSCNPYYTTPQPPEPSPSPSPDILIPSWLRTPKDIATYLRLSGARYVNDDFTTGYQDYRFTPAEFISWDIPDVSHPRLKSWACSSKPLQGLLTESHPPAYLGNQRLQKYLADIDCCV